MESPPSPKQSKHDDDARIIVNNSAILVEYILVSYWNIKKHLYCLMSAFHNFFKKKEKATSILANNVHCIISAVAR